MKVALAADHAGVLLKDWLQRELVSLGFATIDLGTKDTTPSDYPDHARALGQLIAAGEVERGILVCGSGVGASIAANKIKGIRAGLCHDTYSARQGVEHDDMNVLCLGARVIGSATALELARAFLGARFTAEERHVRRVKKILDIEERSERSDQAKKATMNPLQSLHQLGQSIWYDNISRDMLRRGELAAMVREGLLGVTSNPTIFDKAISGSDQYDEQLHEILTRDPAAPVDVLIQELMIRDIQMAADVLAPVFANTSGTDGYVSIEVAPSKARDTRATIEEAKLLWSRVDRPNLMVKIPATREGLPAIEESIASGININVTLIFSIERYREVFETYMRGLERRVARKLPIDAIASVASVFVSRVDTLVDGMLDNDALKGKAAVANTRMVYAAFRELAESDRFRALAEQGARVQRPLWGSTGTKNPAYSDLLYVETLVGPDTVNTVPPQTYGAILDHLQPSRTIDVDVDEARRVLDDLRNAGIDLDAVMRKLEADGVTAFVQSFDGLSERLQVRRKNLLQGNSAKTR